MNSLEPINSPEIIKSLEQVKTYFTAQLTSNPKDISYIATLEKIQQTQSFILNNCKDCIRALKEKLWQTLPSPIAVPIIRQTPYSLQNGMLQKYQAFLQQYQESQPSKESQQQHKKPQEKELQP